MDLLKAIFTPGTFEPHGVHFAGQPWLVWVFYVANAAIALAFIAIPVSLLYVISKRKDIPFHWLFVSFAAFIISCGMTHLMHIVVFTYPAYYLQALMDVITGAISLLTAYAFVFVLPDIVERVPNAIRLDEAKRKLRRASLAIRAQIEARPELQDVLQGPSDTLMSAWEDLEETVVTFRAKG